MFFFGVISSLDLLLSISFYYKYGIAPAIVYFTIFLLWVFFSMKLVAYLQKLDRQRESREAEPKAL
jgi:ABC-type transport system involved in Fe-S cluster assembly fused permease/ATPase subunit